MARRRVPPCHSDQAQTCVGRYQGEVPCEVPVEPPGVLEAAFLVVEGPEGPHPFPGQKESPVRSVSASVASSPVSDQRLLPV